MKLVHQRWLGKKLYQSATHFTIHDSKAHEAAKMIREHFGCSVRVVHDKGPGFTHVFVEKAYADAAMNWLYDQPEF
jgi:hypothetical protein